MIIIYYKPPQVFQPQCCNQIQSEHSQVSVCSHSTLNTLIRKVFIVHKPENDLKFDLKIYNNLHIFVCIPPETSLI